MDVFFLNLKETATNFPESFANWEAAIKKQNSSLPPFLNHVEAGKESGDKWKEKDADDITMVEEEINKGILTCAEDSNMQLLQVHDPVSIDMQIRTFKRMK